MTEGKGRKHKMKSYHNLFLSYFSLYI